MVNRRWPPGPASSGVTTPVSLTRWPSKCSWPPNTSAKAVIGIPTPLPHRGNCVVSFLASCIRFNTFFATTDANSYLPVFNQFSLNIFSWLFFFLKNYCKIVSYVYNTFRNSYLWRLTLTCILSLADNSDQVLTFLLCLCIVFSNCIFSNQH